MNKREELEKEILQAMNEMRIVDHHEHLRDAFLPKIDYEIDLPYFLAVNGYLCWDLIGAGMNQSFWPAKYVWMSPPSGRFAYLNRACRRDETVQRWKEMKHELENVKNTVNYRYIVLSLRELYGLEDEELNDDNWREISSKITEKSKDYSGWAKQILDKMKVFKVNLDLGEPLPNTNITRDDRLVQVVRMDIFVNGDLGAVESLRGESITSFEQYMEALGKQFADAVNSGAVGIKSHRDNHRSPFVEVEKSVAEKTFDKILGQGLEGILQQEKKIFQDFMMHAVCQRCAEYDLPFQIHTGPEGLFETFTSPVLFTNLFRNHPRVIFDVFHGGYPYVRELGILAKSFPNVHVNACWLHSISTLAFKRALGEWLEVVPLNKIFAWGGDQWMTIEHSYATLLLTKQLVAEVLASKVSSGCFSMKVALEITAKIMGENAIRVYRYD